MRAPLIALAVLLVGFSPGWKGGGELRSGAFSLLPPGSSIVEKVEGDCVELAPTPSCMHVYFLAPPVALGHRTRLVDAVAATSGGSAFDSRPFQAGTLPI